MLLLSHPNSHICVWSLIPAFFEVLSKALWDHSQCWLAETDTIREEWVKQGIRSNLSDMFDYYETVCQPSTSSMQVPSVWRSN